MQENGSFFGGEGGGGRSGMCVCGSWESRLSKHPCVTFVPHGQKEKIVHPTSNGGMQNGSSVGICTRCVHIFARFDADLHAQSVIINNNFCIGAQEGSLFRARCWLGRSSYRQSCGFAEEGSRWEKSTTELQLK